MALSASDPDRRARLKAASRLPQEPPSASDFRRQLWVALLFPTGFAAYLAITAYGYFHLRLHLQPWEIGIGAFFFMLPPLAVLSLVARGPAARRCARIYRRAEYCPSCGYDLRTIIPHANGCRDCPECGGAWICG